jgi:quinol monooxygenase YgiN
MKSPATRVIARFHAKPGKEEELAVVLEKLIEPTRAETGCRCYELWRNRTDPTEFTFVEEWVSADALAAHGKTEHIQNGRKAMADLVTGPVDLRLYDRVR